MIISLGNQDKPKQVLIADDDLINRILLKNTLKRLGFEVEIASNGQELHDKFFDKNLLILVQNTREVQFLCVDKSKKIS
jgi:CheY-like chemotaxis protein